MSIKHLYPNSTPALNLNPKSSRVVDPRLSCVRNSIGTYVDPVSGLVKTATANEARVEKDGLLIEDSRTNILLNSATGVTQNVTTTANDYTLSFYGTGSVTLSGTASGTLAGTGANDRVDLTVTATAGSCTITVTGTVTNAQFEQGGFATSYIPTSGSTVQRLADQITLTNSGIFNPNENTIINEPFGVAGGSDTLTVVGDGTKAERTFVYSSHLSQEKFNTLTGVDDWWEWRVLGSSYAFPNLSADGQVTVDWGDGTVETLTTSAHTFTNGSGYHTIRIKQENGTYLYLSPSPTERPKLISIGPVPTSINVWGQYLGFLCPNLETFDAHGANFLNAIYINSGSPKLKSTPYADYSSVTNFSYCWNGASGLTKMPHIDTSNGTGFTGSWWNCSGLTEFPALDFSSSSSLGLRYAWNNCSGLTSFPFINLGNATNLENTWGSNSSLGSFPLLDTSNVTVLSATWIGCSSLTSFPQINTSSVTNWRQTWFNCTGLTSFPLINTSSGTDFYRTWRGCTSMVTFPAGCFNSWSPTTVQNYCFTETWDGCSSLSATSVENILNSIDTSGVSAPSTGPDITIDYNASSGTPNISTAVTNLKNRNWTITLNGVAQ